ncbi:MAG: class I adenylate-forming enzyme family protein [Halioglobus sp.]
MIASRLNTALQHTDQRPFLITSEIRWNYAQTHEAARQLALTLSQSGASRIACQLPDSAELVLLILAAAVAGLPLAIMNRDYSEEQIKELTSELDIDLLYIDAPLNNNLSCQQLTMPAASSYDFAEDVKCSKLPELDAELLIFTSGTTGKPRCVRYRWSDLLAQVRDRRSLDNERWLLAYKLNHFAGVQMLAHILSSQSCLVLADSTRVADAVTAMVSQKVSHVSSTPTFWRFALAILSREQKLPNLKHITLGSEPVSAHLLDQLGALFPLARIVHIYALTEAGSCVSVSDGKAGLPASILRRPDHATVQFRIVEDKLQVKTQHGMLGYLKAPGSKPRTADGWLMTGDLVKVEQDRILFMGRESEVINVGGVKVHPLEVENIVAALPGVKLARVYGQGNPIMGQIVAVDLVLNDGFDAETVEDEIRTACRNLPRHSMPRSMTIVDSIDTNNFKLTRRGSETA